MNRHHLADAYRCRVLASLCCVIVAGPVLAQFQGGGGGGLGGAGGIHVDANGILRTGPTRHHRASRRGESAEKLPGAELRRVSLSRLAKALDAAIEANEPVPETVRHLAGLTRVQYVSVDRAGGEVYLAGPAESWSIARDGRALGTQTGRPILYLDDLLCALRCVLDGAGEIYCSIDPEPAGLRALGDYTIPHPHSRGVETTVLREVGNRLGRQRVSTRGVPAGSRFARVMIEADYRMKRMAIGVERVRGLKSHLEALMALDEQGGSAPNLARWWFEPAYQPIGTSADESVFELRGQGVRLASEELGVDPQGRRHTTGKPGSLGDAFANDFSRRFGQLEGRYPVFADLHNLFDLLLAAAIVERYGEPTNLRGTSLLDADRYPIPTGVQPEWADPIVTCRRHRTGEGIYLTFAFGGVMMNPTAVLASLAPAAANTPHLARFESALDTADPAGQETENWWTDATTSDE